MKKVKEICLSEDACCNGPKAARVLIEENRVIIKDRCTKSKTLSKEGWEQLKEYLFINRRLPTYVKSKITLLSVELEQLIMFVEAERDIEASRTFI